MKAGHKKGWREDVRNFLAIREAVGSDITLGMDPNTGWSVSETISVLRALEPHRLDYLEQPIDRYDLKGMAAVRRSEEHTSELQSLMRISYAVFCLKKKKDK